MATLHGVSFQRQRVDLASALLRNSFLTEAASDLLPTASPDGTDSIFYYCSTAWVIHRLHLQSSGPHSACRRQLSCCARSFSLPLEMGYGWFEAIDLEHGGDLIRPHKAEKRRVDSLAVCLYLDELLDALDWEPKKSCLWLLARWTDSSRMGNEAPVRNYEASSGWYHQRRRRTVGRAYEPSTRK